MTDSTVTHTGAFVRSFVVVLSLSRARVYYIASRFDAAKNGFNNKERTFVLRSNSL
jgi:hypothetical protein